MLRNINVDVFSKMIKWANTYIIDFRDKEEFLENKIEGSINLSIEEIDKILKIIPNKNSKIIVCCSRGIRSIAAGEHICELGYKNVYNLDGGISIFFRKAR